MTNPLTPPRPKNLPDLSELVRQPEQQGWMVCNFFRMPSGLWQCNLYGPEGRSYGHTEMAEGRTPEEAFAAAVENIGHAKAFAAQNGPTEVRARLTPGFKRLRKVLERLT